MAMGTMRRCLPAGRQALPQALYCGDGTLLSYRDRDDGSQIRTDVAHGDRIVGRTLDPARAEHASRDAARPERIIVSHAGDSIFSPPRYFCSGRMHARALMLAGVVFGKNADRLP